MKNRHKLWANRAIKSHQKLGTVLLFSSKDLEDLAAKTTKCRICQDVLDWSCKEIHYKSPTLNNLWKEKNLSLEKTAIICRHCELSKGDRTIDEFINHMELMRPNVILALEKLNKTINYQI